MSINSERKEIVAVVGRLLDNLSGMISSQSGVTGYTLRREVGDMRAFTFQYLEAGTFGVHLLNCFTIAREGSTKLAAFVKVRENLFTENPTGEICNNIVQAAISFCLSAESRIISGMEFTRRDDVELMIKVMRIAFDQARELAADNIDSTAYQSLTFLAGALTSHLANTALKLPRLVEFEMPISFPILVVSQRVYQSGERWEELINENQIIHPAFSPRSLKGLNK